MSKRKLLCKVLFFVVLFPSNANITTVIEALRKPELEHEIFIGICFCTRYTSTKLSSILLRLLEALWNFKQKTGPAPLFISKAEIAKTEKSFMFPA